MATFWTLVQRDTEAEVWVADASNIPGLAAEARDLPALYQAMEQVAPLLVKENLYRGMNVPEGVVHHEIVVIDGNKVVRERQSLTLPRD